MDFTTGNDNMRIIMKRHQFTVFLGGRLSDEFFSSKTDDKT